MSALNTGGPAFPCDELDQGGPQVYQQFHGMTLRDYFAAHAPEMPKWFRHEADEPIPEGENRQAWIRRNQAAKFFEWRGFYADAMIAERAK